MGVGAKFAGGTTQRVRFVCFAFTGRCAPSPQGGTMLGRCLAIFGAGVSFVLAVARSCAAYDIDAKAQACAACHGQNGVPTDPKTIPIIWGQEQSYLVKQLHDYRSGDRDSPIMSPIAKQLAREDLRKIAAYFAPKSWPAQPAAAAAAAPPPPKG